MDINKINIKKNIVIKGANLHNLKNLDVVIPRNKFVVITGLSGSGKSSLAFDTLYAEGQRRYVESLSSYARQFLGKLNKPKVDFIKGISPAIAIEQKVNTTNPRSTVGTSTEIYDYLKLLFARIGKTYSPISGNEVKKHTISDVIKFIKNFNDGTKMLLLSPIKINKDENLNKILEILKQQGYARIQYKKIVYKIDDFKNKKTTNFNLVVDRIVVRHKIDFFNRLSDSLESAFFEGKGICYIQNIETNIITEFNNKFELDGMVFLKPTKHLFNFNTPYGACSKCNGYGSIVGIDKDLVIPNTGLSIYDDAIVPFKTKSYSNYKTELILNSEEFGISIHKPWFELDQEKKQIIWNGTKKFKGINNLFKKLEEKKYKIQNRVMLSRYRGKTSCDKCKGKRLKQKSNYVKIYNKSISDLVTLPINDLLLFFKNIELDETQKKIAKRLLTEIKNRLQFISDVGLGYLTLNRSSNTLSGGESQRINLATSLGSSLVGSMYILDEPSIGLHPRDSKRLIKVIKNLRDIGNTVIVVEHDEDIMKEADYIIDIGPEAGTNGGKVVAQGIFKKFLKSNSLTSKYLSGKIKIDIPKKRKKSNFFIKINGARENNLKNIDVTLPLNNLTVITGVSGSGKSTLVKNILFPAIQKKIYGYGNKIGQHTSIEGDFNKLNNIEFINQNPIGKSSRSNPVTYIKAYDDIRHLLSIQKLSKLKNFQPKHFSFNVDGGRCKVCKGVGEITIEMQFMADVHLQCDSCNGKRFKKEILKVEYKGLNIDDILKMTIDNAIIFFTKENQNKIIKKLKPLQDVGLGYIQLGQSSSTLSGGEAQRIKLASFISKVDNKNKTLFIFDEPTTGLHFHDIKKLLKSFDILIKNGNSIIVIEHNIELIKCADYIIDLGKEGGEKGGNLIFEGTPENLIKNKESYTAKYLKNKLLN